MMNIGLGELLVCLSLPIILIAVVLIVVGKKKRG